MSEIIIFTISIPTFVGVFKWFFILCHLQDKNHLQRFSPVHPIQCMFDTFIVKLKKSPPPQKKSLLRNRWFLIYRNFRWSFINQKSNIVQPRYFPKKDIRGNLISDNFNVVSLCSNVHYFTILHVNILLLPFFRHLHCTSRYTPFRVVQLFNNAV